MQKIDQMYSVFCNQPLERVRKFTERDYFFSAAEVCILKSEDFWIPELCFKAHGTLAMCDSCRESICMYPCFLRF